MLCPRKGGNQKAIRFAIVVAASRLEHSRRVLRRINTAIRRCLTPRVPPCQCGECQTCRRRAYLRRWKAIRERRRAARMIREVFLADLETGRRVKRAWMGRLIRAPWR